MATLWAHPTPGLYSVLYVLLACTGIPDCASCSDNNVCGACTEGKVPSSDGTACEGKDLFSITLQKPAISSANDYALALFSS